MPKNVDGVKSLLYNKCIIKYRMDFKLKRIYNFINGNFFNRYIFILTFTISIVTLFGNIKLSDFPKPIFFVKVGLVFIIPLFVNMFFAILSNHLLSIKDNSGILKVINHRIGSQISLRTLDENEYDNIHKYTLVYRQDQLNFESSDYNSFRILKGKNASKYTSSFLVYTESSDIPMSFKDIKIKAKNNINGKSLVVECLHSTTEKRLQHTFKINFDTPISPGQIFDISYSIIIPNELSVYDKSNEIQSISLIRIKKPISKLKFNICLNFEPRAVKTYAKKSTNELTEINGAKVSKYVACTELQKYYYLQWGNCIPYIIETEIEKPDYDQYIIEFFY